MRELLRMLGNALLFANFYCAIGAMIYVAKGHDDWWLKGLVGAAVAGLLISQKEYDR
jgi:hypothetical protein